MKRLVVLLAACSGADQRPVERPIEHPVEQPAATMPATTVAHGRPAPAPAGPAIAAVKNVRDTYHGVAVDDPYRWLEGDGTDVKAWVGSQNAHARKILEQLPAIDALRAEVTAILKAPITRYSGFLPAGGKLFGYRKDPNKEQAELIVLDDPATAEGARLLFDPTADGSKHRSIDWFRPSPDGTRIAVSVSEKGSEAGSLHFFDTTGKQIDVVIPNVQRGTGGGSVAWTADGKGIYYTRYPAAGEKPDSERDFWMQVWFHALGTPVASDRYEMGKDLPKIAEIALESDARNRVIATVQNGDGGEYRHYLRDAKGAWHQLSDWRDEIAYIGFGTTADLWLVSTKDAPRGKVMSLRANATSAAAAKLVVPQGKDAIFAEFNVRAVVDAGDRFFLTYQSGGPTELRAFTRAGKPTKSAALPSIATTYQPIVWKPGVVITGAMSYSTPFAFYRFDTKTNKTTLLADISPKPPVDLSNVEPIREYATSKDGTRVPFTVMWPKGAPKDGSVPCLATGYGGYGLSRTPYYMTTFAPLLTRGVCIVDTNLRGGSEFGEDWHRAGMLTNKQNVFDDFAAVLQQLATSRYTSPPKLAILGGSNGGLLMGATLVQHPELVKAVVSLVGIYDMVRVERTANGEYNTTEFGSVKDKAQFEALHAYSPYHHVAKATYPAVLMSAGDNDPRVAPWHSRKMIAALQAAQRGDAPILLKTSATAGHGAGTAMSERIEDTAQMLAFVLWQLQGQ